QLASPTLAMPLAEGVPALNTSWLSQLIFAAAYQAGGSAALSVVFTLVTFASLLLFAVTFYLQAGRKRAMLVGLFLTLGLGCGAISQLQPESLAFLCFSALLLLLVRGAKWQIHAGENAFVFAADAPKPASSPASALPLAVWTGVPLLTALWANFDASF